MPRHRYDDDEVYDDDDDYEDDDVDNEDYDDEDEEYEDDQPRGRERVRAERAARSGGLKDKFGIKDARPGEQDIVRSPLVLSLIIGCTILLLVAAVFYFLNLRTSAERQFQAAEEEMDRGSYSTAIQMFDAFLSGHSAGHELVPKCRLLRGKCEILQEIGGSTPDWIAGVEAAQEFIRKNKDVEGYDEHLEDLSKYAEQIARGAAKQAESQKGDALLERSPDLLQASKEGLAIAVRLSGDEKPEDLMRDLEAITQRTEALILRQETFVNAVKEIEKFLEQKEPIKALEARSNLLNRYGDFATNASLRSLMAKTLEVEKSLLTIEDLDRDAAEADNTAPDLPSLTMVVLTNAQTNEVPSGRVVLVNSKDCLYGIDMTTGDPHWRQVIGSFPPFFPQPVTASVAGLLSYNSETGELMLLDRSNGAVVWRQSIGELVAAEPVVHEGQIYLVTEDRHLYKVNLESGKISKRLTFSQPIQSAPVMMDGWLIVGGRTAVLYTLDPRSLECKAISYIGHGAGPIASGMVPMGKLLMFAENTQSHAADLRVMRWDEESHEFTEAQTETVEGQVLDKMVLRGNQLYVPSSGRRIAAFTVSDSPENKPLVRTASSQVEGEYIGPIYLEAGDGRLWMATDALQTLEVQQRTINLEPRSTAEGIATQPLQRVGEHLFAARRMPYTFAAYISQVDRDSLTGYWRTVVGSRIVATTTREDGSSVCITETGHVFRLNNDELFGAPADNQSGSARFIVEPDLTLKLPDDMQLPVTSTRLPNNQVAICASGTSGRLWVLSESGQLARQAPITGTIELPPVPLERGVAVAMNGKLSLVGRPSGLGRVQDFLAPVEQGKEVHWKHLVAMGEDQLLAFDDQQRLFRVQYRKSPVSHLAGVAKFTLPNPVDVAPAVLSADRIVLADAARQLSVLDAQSLETLTTVALEGTPTNAVFAHDQLAMVELDSTKLVAYRMGDELQPAWTVELSGGGIAGPPLAVADQLIFQENFGRIIVVAADSGEVQTTVDLKQRLDGSPVLLGNVVWAVAADGTLINLSSVVSPN